MNRDSILWWVLIIGAVLGYMATLPPPTEWDYKQWLNAAVSIIGIIAAKMATSPLPGKPKE